jgi:hypothetical protein
VLKTDQSLLTSGKLDAAFMYLNKQHAGLPYVTFPDQVSLSNPDMAGLYSAASCCGASTSSRVHSSPAGTSTTSPRCCRPRSRAATRAPDRPLVDRALRRGWRVPRGVAKRSHRGDIALFGSPARVPDYRIRASPSLAPINLGPKYQ